MLRFWIIVYWSVVIGIIYSIITNSGNVFALGWPTLFLSIITGISAFYVGYQITKNLWRIK